MEENIHFEDCEDDTGVEAWDFLTDEQKENFKKITEKNKENLSYIG